MNSRAPLRGIPLTSSLHQGIPHPSRPHTDSPRTSSFLRRPRRDTLCMLSPLRRPLRGILRMASPLRGTLHISTPLQDILCILNPHRRPHRGILRTSSTPRILPPNTRNPHRSVPLDSRLPQDFPLISRHAKVARRCFERPRLQCRSLPLPLLSRVQEHQEVCHPIESAKARVRPSLPVEELRGTRCILEGFVFVSSVVEKDTFELGAGSALRIWLQGGVG